MSDDRTLMNRKQWIFWLIAIAVLAGLVLERSLHRSQPAPASPPAVSLHPTPVSDRNPLVARWVSPPAPKAAAAAASEGDGASKKRIRLPELLEATTNPKKLTAEQLAQHVERNHGSAESLLAAFQHSRDTNWLLRAARDYGDDPKVQLRVLGLDLSPSERTQWIEAFRQSAPDNALADYLAAAHRVKQGDWDQALAVLEAGNGKKEFTVFTAAFMQNAEELYRLAGNDELVAKARAFTETEFPHLPALRHFSRALESYHGELVRTGRVEEADQIALMGLRMAQHLSLGDGSRTLISQLVGLAIERSFVGQLDPNRSHAGLPMPVTEMQQALNEQQESLKRLARGLNEALEGIEEGTLLRYFDRIKVFGEYEAMLWLQRQIGMETASSPPR